MKKQEINIKKIKKPRKNLKLDFKKLLDTKTLLKSNSPLRNCFYNKTYITNSQYIFTIYNNLGFLKNFKQKTNV